MKKEVTKPAKKKLELKKSTIVKFVMSNNQMKALVGGVINDTQNTSAMDEGCVGQDPIRP